MLPATRGRASCPNPWAQAVSGQRYRTSSFASLGFCCFTVWFFFGDFWATPKLDQADNIEVKQVPDDSKYIPCHRFDTITSTQFRPVQFFEHGPGKAFQQKALDARDDLNLQSRFLWYQESIDCSFVYYHIHKNGGKSMGRHVQNIISMEKFNSDRQQQMGLKNYTKQAIDYLEQVCESQATTNKQSIPIFTFLRDPLERFLSSLGQVLKGPKGLLRQRLSPCHTSMRTADLIGCVLDKMEQVSSFLDQHFTPQSFELYVGVQGLDISIQVADLSLLSRVVVQLGGDRDFEHENSAAGVIEDYPQFILTPTALTYEFKKRICQLYESDVVMLEQTRVTRSECTGLGRT